MLDFSLTDNALEVAKRLSMSSPHQLILAFASDESGLSAIWHTWTIYAAGGIGFLLYLCGFVLWTYGFAVLARAPDHS